MTEISDRLEKRPLEFVDKGYRYKEAEAGVIASGIEMVLETLGVAVGFGTMNDIHRHVLDSFVINALFGYAIGGAIDLVRYAKYKHENDML